MLTTLPFESKTNTQLTLTSILSQFSVSFLFILLAYLVSFFLLLKYAAGLFLYIGSSFLGLLFAITIICAISFLSKQNQRPSHDKPSEFEVKSSDGRSLKMINPPDNVFSKEETSAIMRFLTVGFDDKLCPDGEVLGHSSEGKFTHFTEEEKMMFKTRHLQEIQGKKNVIKELYEQSRE
jgi:hypothetical protein